MVQKNSFPYAFDYGADWEHYGQSVHTSSLYLYTNCSHIQLRQLGLWITGYLPTICQPINPLLYVHRHATKCYDGLIVFLSLTCTRGPSRLDFSELAQLC